MARARITRRRLCAGLSAAGALLVARPSLSAVEPTPLPVQEVAPGIHVFQGAHELASPENLGGIANIGFIVGDASVAVIDPGGSPAQGRALRAAVRRVTDLPVAYVILSHVHPDHVFGATAFEADRPEVIGHARLPGALAARGPFYLANLSTELGPAADGAKVVLPTATVEKRTEIDLGGRVLELTAHPTAHTDNDLTVFDRETGTLWAADLLFMERIPALDGSLNGWIAVLEDLRRLQADRVVPGHGPVSAPWPAALDAEEGYLRALRDAIRGVIAAGGTMDEAVRTVLPDAGDGWLLFDSYHARNIVTGFAELEWE